MEILYRCRKCKTEFRLDEREQCQCPKCGSMLADQVATTTDSAILLIHIFQ